MNKVYKVEVSHRTIIFAVVFLLLLGFVYLIRDIIFEFFIALVAMAIFNPFVNKLQKYKIPRALGIIIVYLLIFAIIGITIASLIPTLIVQTQNFVNTVPDHLDNFGYFGSYSEQVVSQLIAQLGSLPTQIAKFTVSVFSNAIAVVTVLIFSFYLLLYREKLDSQLGYFLGEKKKNEVAKVIDTLENSLGTWARAQLALMIIIWITTYIGLLLLGIPYSLPLSILAGIFEIIPTVGPLVSAVPGVLIGFGMSPIIGIATASLYFLIQQFENYLIVPKIMEKSTGVNPLVTLISLAVGFRVAGLAGVIISVPVVITIKVLSKKYIIDS